MNFLLERSSANMVPKPHISRILDHSAGFGWSASMACDRQAEFIVNGAISPLIARYRPSTPQTRR